MGTAKTIISIHAPHAGRDAAVVQIDFDRINFNPRAPCGARLPASQLPEISSVFQSTRPMRGATGTSANNKRIAKLFQSTRPMRGATRSMRTSSTRARNFNPRAPCGARHEPALSQLKLIAFQSTRPMRGATWKRTGVDYSYDISIHAPHAGRDKIRWSSRKPRLYFNPRAPCGARRPLRTGHCPASIFQSTRPMRGATSLALALPRPSGHFNPRAPCGARQQKYTKLLYTLLRQKAILRQFHAKRRLLKRFSTYKYRNTFLICSANRMGKICTLPLRTTRSLDLPEGMSACSQSARFCFRTFFPSSKTTGYPAPDP